MSEDSNAPRDRSHYRVGRVVDAYLRRRYSVLFFTLLVLLVAIPLRRVLNLGAGMLEIIVAVNIVVAAANISERPRRQRLIIVLAGLVVAGRFLPGSLVPAGLAATIGVAWVAVALLAAGAAVRFALRATAVDTEHVSAALSAYLLAGLVFAVLYLSVERALPGSVVDLSAPGDAGLTLETAIYFSFVTLATLGYGDVVPREGVARGLAVVEALGAQLYLTVTVARLVGLYSQSQRRNTAAREEHR